MAESEHYNGRYILLPCPLEVLGAGEEKETERVDCSWDEYITNKSSALFTSHTHTGLKTKFHTKMVTIWFFPRKKGERRWLCWLSQCWRGTRGRYKVASLHHTKLSSQLFFITLSPNQFWVYLTKNLLLDLKARKDNCKKKQFHQRCKESSCERANITETPSKKCVSDWFASQGNM